ncbi:RidA family protein [Chloroflexota bacterium]
MEIKRTPTIIAGKQAPYAKGTAVTGNQGFVWLSGSTGIETPTGRIPEDAGEQATIALQNIKARLEEYGAPLKNIVHVWQYIKGDFPDGITANPDYTRIKDAIEAFWKVNCPEFVMGNNPPANTLLGVTALARKPLKLEILVMAAIE